MIEINCIPKSESDILLNDWGYDLMEEYFKLISAANFPSNSFILDLATGTGRVASILSRLGNNVLTGDINPELKSESENRISEEYIHKIKYLRLNLESIPLPENSIENIVCIDTLHELENPITCLNEIIRIHSGKGKLLIADFNSDGFDLMDKLHTARYGKLHPRGKISSNESEGILTRNYSEIKEINTKLNRGFIITGKRNER